MASLEWEKKFLDMAKLVSSWSKDPSTKVGAVITDKNNRLVSVGYNGFPVGVSDDYRLKDRNTKYNIIVHAEMNAIMFANKVLTGCILYTYPFEPCSRCASVIIQTGIKRIVSYVNSENRWEENFQLSRKLFMEAGVELEYYEKEED